MVADWLIQAVIGVLGILVAWINLSPKATTRRWACLLGLIAQPAWFWTAWQAQQWGVLACSVGYTAVFAHGIRVQWLGRSLSTTD